MRSTDSFLLTNLGSYPDSEQRQCWKTDTTPRVLAFTKEGLTVWKVSKYGVISGPYLPVLRLNKESYGVSLRIQSEYRKIRTKNNSVFGHFSRSVFLNLSNQHWLRSWYNSKEDPFNLIVVTAMLSWALPVDALCWTLVLWKPPHHVKVGFIEGVLPV